MCRGTSAGKCNSVTFLPISVRTNRRYGGQPVGTHRWPRRTGDCTAEPKAPPPKSQRRDRSPEKWYLVVRTPGWQDALSPPRQWVKGVAETNSHGSLHAEHSSFKNSCYRLKSFRFRRLSM